MLGQAGKSSRIWSIAPHVVSIFSSWCLSPLLILQHTHGHVELWVPSSLPVGPVIPVVDIKMPRQGHPLCGSIPCLGSHPTLSASPCPLHPLAWLEPQPILSQRESKLKPSQQRSSYLLLEKGGNTFFDNYCFFHLTGCKLVNFFL